MIRVVVLANSDLKYKIFFVDFKDSFSHNILSYLKSWGPIEIVSPHMANELLAQGQQRFIWGPGPGRADEYGIDLDLLRTSVTNMKHRHFGICLGHQLLGLALGGVYGKEDFPLHGVARKISLPEWNDWGMAGESEVVQSYNSLTIELNENADVRVWKQNGSVVMLATKNVFSCQFHPESVGTSCPERFFSAVRRNFL